ncbi:Uncharacterised protein [Yersinia enterocolitica]|nr:hypothetical protein DJ62_908 [Yersinia enterocolitica]KGA73330.1 hypothetical protein DJ61_2989 [Yersinia enterocolitica]CNE91799.1 Uncharacterised protein [Yersinia enterocolitica]CNF94489.1 Uncharacterised protein [Yersinia enterocolitica]CNG36495.1 Uncharacterised protein [Yersinia enterocolitica]
MPARQNTPAQSGDGLTYETNQGDSRLKRGPLIRLL